MLPLAQSNLWDLSLCARASLQGFRSLTIAGATATVEGSDTGPLSSGVAWTLKGSVDGSSVFLDFTPKGYPKVTRSGGGVVKRLPWAVKRKVMEVCGQQQQYEIEDIACCGLPHSLFGYLFSWTCTALAGARGEVRRLRSRFP